MFRNASSSVWALLVVAVVLGSGARATEPIPDRVWHDLASDEPATAARAVAALEAAGPKAVAFLRERLKPLKADPRRMDALIQQLDSPQFVKRRQATEELEYLGKLAEPQLKKALASNPPLEVLRRLEQLLRCLQPPFDPRAEEEKFREALVRAAFPKRRGRTPYSDILRANPAVLDNPTLKIIFKTPGGEMTPREVIMRARAEQASVPLALPDDLDELLRKGPSKKAKGPPAATPPVSPAWQRAAAAIRVLERVGNSEAQELLRIVAAGTDDTLPTVEARSALNRLKAQGQAVTFD